MTNSIRRARKFSRSGVAAASAVSLALGAFSVVGPGPLASAAEEEVDGDTSLTGGIRGANGSGVVNTGDQMASDLDAGSCVVQSVPRSEAGSQAGFSWVRVEPSNNTDDKRTWGVSVAFDNSKDRTFASWEWNSSSFNTAPVTLGTVPAAPAGEPLGTDVTASDQANEQLEIAKGFRITYGVQSVLTEEEVAKFAQADSPVRYVWKTQYNKDNISDSRLQATTNSNFIALVNPWPSENDQCAPIEVTWEGIQEHVIVPGEDTKVGHIDVPALSDGSVDDSLSRMVVEAYDGNGKYIASSDTSASGGDKQLLRVDDKGDIYFTWPEYRGTDLAADKNVQFSVVAKPRTTGQLEEASASSGWYGSAAPKVFDSSNSLPRYSKANEIGRNTISLDDTEYHDPQYNTDEQTITSGIETDGSLTNQPQKVVFKQVPDLIPDLEKKKGDGGFEAKVVLDQRYVFEGWKAEMDPETYDVTVTSPSNPKPGTFAQPRVVVEYSNGSKDELSLLVIVDPNHTQITDLVRPAVAKGEANKDITSQITTKSIMNGYAPVAPATFEVDQSTVPAGWTVTVDNTGEVTAKADDTVAPGTIISPKVTATYPDGTADEIEPQFQAIVDIKIPAYDTVTNKPGTEVSLTPKVPEVGLTGNASDEAPERYTFEDGKTEKTVKDAAGEWKLAINEKTGEITTTIPRTAPEGHILDIPVLAHYSEDSENKPQRVKGTVVVLKGDIAPVYSVESTGPNQAVDHQVQDAPEGSTFSFGKKPDGSPLTEMTTEDGWKYTIDPKTGVVTSTPPAGSKPGDKKTITVDVATPTGDTPKVPVTTVVKLTNNWEAEPNYPVETVYPGDTATLPVTLQKPDNVNVAKYELGAVPQGWTVSIDNDGKITATAPADAVPGSQVEIPVTVTYEDGSKDTATAVVNVVDVPTRPVPFGVEYVYDDTIPAGEYKTVTKGVAGEEKQKRDGTWEQTTAPTNEVVHVGTKPATASEDVTWTAPIPYSTTTRPNPALAPGETKVVQQGVNGERTYTAKFTATGDQASVVESEDTKQPVEEIIEYGPRLDDQELVTETTRKIPFETTIVFDNTLEAGTQVVDTQGVVGEEKVTSTQKLVDGKPSGDPVVTTTTVTPKQDAVIRVGTKTEGQTTKTVEADVPFGVKVEFDPNMPAGTSETVTEGKPGKKTITVTQKVTNSQPDGEATVEEKITEQPVDQVIKVGTKPSEASAQVKWTAPVPFEVETRPNSELKPGEIKVVQQGVPGEKTYTADFAATGSDATVTPKEEQTKAPVNEIIEYGPRLDDQNLVTTVTKPVPFETEIVFDDSLDSGKQEVKQEGKLGEDTVTSTQKLVDGKPSGDPVVETKRTEEPVKQIIRVGTKTEGANTVEHTEPVPFETKVEYDPNMPAGTYEVVTPGKAGEKTVKVTQTIVNSEVTDTKREENVTTQPVTEVIKVGTKQATATDKVEWTEPIPFSTIVRPNTDLKPGEVKTVQEGKNGEAKYTATFEGTNGQATVTESKDRTEPTDKIVEYGPTIADQTLTSTTTRPIKFETEIIFDDTLPAGEQKVDQQGENGEEKITSTQEIKDGMPVGEPTIATETKEPTKAIIRVGTKPTTTTATTTATTTEKSTTTEATRVEVPTTITTTLTSTKEIPTTVSGTPTTITETKEVPTTITTQVPTTVPTTVKETSTTTEQVPTTITTTLTSTEKVPTTVSGTPTTITETKEVPTTITTKVPTTVPTTVKETATATSTATTTVTKEPEPVNASETVKLPFTTKIIFDDTLEPGTEVEDVKGVDGEVKVTFTDGKATAETVKEPVQRVVRVGSKPAAGVEWTEEIAYDVKVEEDPNLEAGKYVVAQQGKPGQTVHKTDGTVETTEPTDHIIKVGTKNADSVDSEFKSPIPAPVVIQYDPNLPAGTVQDDPANPGVDGEKTVTVTHKMVNGQPVGEPVVTEKVITEPQPRIVKVGTKQPTAGEQVTWTEPIPFQTTFRENPDLAPGETRVVQEGKDGEATYYVEFKANGESATVENTNQRVEPVERIVEYGPRANGDEISSQVTRPVEFKTSVIYDDTLEEGKQVITQGELGEEVVTTTQKLVDGKPSGDPVTTTEVTKAPVNAVIRIGTKKPGTPDPAPEVSELVDLPFTTKIVYDPTLEPGQEIEDVAGANGQVKVTVVNGKATVETVKEPVQRVVRVGTKPADAEWTEEIPFKVVVRENPELTREQSRIAQQGVPGLKRHINGAEEVLREPVDYILEVGTKEAEAEQPVYSPVALRPGQTAQVELSGGHAKGNQYRKLDWPEGWEGTVDPATGKVRVTPPADAKPGTKVKLPVEVTDASGAKATVYADVTVLEDGAVATTTPEEDKGSSDKAQRCVANAFSKNSPILWLLPVALLGAVGYGVNEAFGPQIQQASAQINEAIRRNTPDFGIGRGVEQPEWMRQINAQVDAINRQFAPVAKQLEPVGIALGVIGALALTGTLIAQACSEEGFDNGLTVLSSK